LFCLFEDYFKDLYLFFQCFKEKARATIYSPQTCFLFSCAPQRKRTPAASVDDGEASPTASSNPEARSKKAKATVIKVRRGSCLFFSGHFAK
jgi:hypothetical protein